MAIWKILVPLNYADLPNVDRVHYTVSKKNIFINTTTHQKSLLSARKLLRSLWQIQVFQS